MPSEPPSTAPRRKEAGLRAALLSLLSFLALLAVYWIVFAADRAFHQRWLRGEDRLYEWLTFAGFLAAGIVLLSSLRFRASMCGWSRAYIAGLGLFFLVCAGEEISWGQRILGFGTPEAMAQANEQNEFNLHNLRIEHIHPYDIVSLGLAVFGILLPLASVLPPARGRAWRRYVAPPWLVPCFVLAAALSPLQRAVRPALAARFGDEVALVSRLDSREMTEMFWGLACMLAAFSLRSAWKAAGRAEGGDDQRAAGR